jgi:DNA-binding transcriptional ArsR family regulator
MSDIVHCVSKSPPSILPLFRSEQQAALLGYLFSGRGVEASVTDIATRTGIPRPTVNREVERLEVAGIVKSRPVGRSRLVSADWNLPWADHLAAILAQTIGVEARLVEALDEVAGVDAAYVFGSWAARTKGEPGQPPRDVDLLVVGDPDFGALTSALSRVERQANVEVNVVVKSADEWRRADTGFLQTIRERPLVELRLARAFA